MTDFVVIIPARFASSRFPGKPLVDILGKSMIERTWLQAKKSAASEVIIATDDPRIFDHCLTFTSNVMMTRDDHVSGTDRIREVCANKGYLKEQIVVNVQGDEPAIPAEIIDQVAHLLELHSSAGVSTLVKRIHSLEQWRNINVVKAVMSGQQALYFSRSPVPCHRDAPENLDNCYAHIGIYGYRVDALDQFVTFNEGHLESIEKLEQLRFLENKISIVAEQALIEPPVGVDSPDDIKIIEAWLQS
jgi:3-deoxy-manno-octulosonate cytidylyltransferase (CMP-KDO synthetase)